VVGGTEKAVLNLPGGRQARIWADWMWEQRYWWELLFDWEWYSPIVY